MVNVRFRTRQAILLYYIFRTSKKNLSSRESEVRRSYCCLRPDYYTWYNSIYDVRIYDCTQPKQARKSVGSNHHHPQFFILSHTHISVFAPDIIFVLIGQPLILGPKASNSAHQQYTVDFQQAEAQAASSNNTEKQKKRASNKAEDLSKQASANRKERICWRSATARRSS